MFGRTGYLRWAVLRRFPVVFLIVVPITALSAVAVQQMPDRYESSGRIMLELGEGVGPANPTLRQNLEATRAQIIREKLLSSRTLREILANTRIPQIELSELHTNLTVQRNTGRDKATFIDVSFTSSNPQDAQLVTNLILQRMITDTAKRERDKAAIALREATGRAEKQRAELAQLDAELLRFKNDNLRTLPGELNRLMSNQASLEQQLNDLSRLIQPQNGQIESLRIELAAAEAIYASNHPTVRTLRAQLEYLAAHEPRLPDQYETRDDLTRQLSEVRSLIAKLPHSEMKLHALQRAQLGAQGAFEAARERQKSAQTDMDIQTQNRGTRLVPIESASAPLIISGKKKKAIFAVCTAFSIMLAAIVVFLLNRADTVIRRSHMLHNHLGLTPLGILPDLSREKQIST